MSASAAVRTTGPTPPGPVVVGLGATARGDDGCGARVVRALRGHVDPAVRLVEPLTDPMALLDLWGGAPLAILVDAALSGAAPGTVRRIEAGALEALRSERPTSSHALSVREAYELGRSLRRLPRRLVVYAIEASDLRPGEQLSPEVEAAVDATARRIAGELARDGPGAPPR